jgi:hypothetical protein
MERRAWRVAAAHVKCPRATSSRVWQRSCVARLPVVPEGTHTPLQQVCPLGDLGGLTAGALEPRD